MKTKLDNNLNLIEIFASVQGETSFAGLPTTFIRLARCNLRCSWCDTTYSFGRGTPHSLESIMADVERFGCKHICITGGEPLLQPPVYELMKNLCDVGYIISLETSGSLPIDLVDSRVHIILDVKCPRSEMAEKNHWDNLNMLKAKDHIKFVIQDKEDYLFAKEICARYEIFDKVSEVLFSPVHGVLESKELVNWILEDRLPVRLNLQIHKFIWTPQTRGV